jgi:hypothetical protein
MGTGGGDYGVRGDKVCNQVMLDFTRASIIEINSDCSNKKNN